MTTIPPPLLLIGAVVLVAAPIATVWTLQRKSDFVRRWSTPIVLLVVTAEIVAVMTFLMLASSGA